MKNPPVFLTPRFTSRPEPKSSEAKWALFGPLAVMVLAFISRAVRLGSIKTLVFDETYYVKDAYGLIKRGYEVQWPKDYDSFFISGQITVPTQGSFVVHPTVGKWLIGMGIEVFGNNPWGWRIAVCLAGAISVFLFGRIIWHLLGNGKMATLASFLLAIDGVQIALSRTAILDVILEMFVLLGVLFLVRDQLSYRPKLLAALKETDELRKTRALQKSQLESSFTSKNGSEGNGSTLAVAPSGSGEKSDKETGETSASEPGTTATLLQGFSTWREEFGPIFWWRPWLMTAGIAWGLAMSVKWSGVYLVAVFGIFIFMREMTARWATEPKWIRSSILTGGIPAFLNLVPISAVVYLLSWTGWFIHPEGWGHTQGGNALGDWWIYHQEILNFHTTLESDHPYKSNPWGWLLQIRPTSFYYEKVAGDCGSDHCIQSVTSLANPLLWWLGFLAFLAVLVAAFVFLDWRAGLIVAGYFATYGPWLIYSNRTIFTFYTVVISPFVVMSLIYVLGILMGKWRVVADKNWTGRYNLVSAEFPVKPSFIWISLVIVAVIFFVTVFFFPIWTGMTIPQGHFYWRMWFRSWI